MILKVADARRILHASDYGKGHKKQKVRKQAKTETIELADSHDIETSDDIVSEIRKDRKPYALKVAKSIEESSSGDRVLMEDAANCLRDDSAYIKEIANRIEAASRREQYEICHIISKLVMDSELLRDSDERNGKPYKLFGEPLTIAYGRFACQLYRAANIQRKFWLAYLKETHSDPEGIDEHLRRCFRDRRCSRK